MAVGIRSQRKLTMMLQDDLKKLVRNISYLSNLTHLVFQETYETSDFRC